MQFSEHETLLKHSPLGKETNYLTQYDPNLLFAIPREFNRSQIQVSMPLPFHGGDLWTAYELSWLNSKGKPEVALMEFYVPCDSRCIVESKSIKLYLNAISQTRFADVTEVVAHIKTDLSAKAEADVTVKIFSLTDPAFTQISQFAGVCLDGLDIEVDTYTVTPHYLKTTTEQVTESVYSHLLRSNCEITKQPDWASVQISYTGPKIDHANLLKYLISFREHNEFHEPCCERIFIDILRQCHCQELTVYLRYTRRGGLDINPFRSTHATHPPAVGRLVRQ